MSVEAIGLRLARALDLAGFPGQAPHAAADATIGARANDLRAVA